MRLKAIFSDIDGTLINSKHQITAATIESVQNLAEREIPFVLVSARMPKAIYPLQETLKISAPIICYSGALVLGSEQEIIESITIPCSQMDKMIAVIQEDFTGTSFSIYSHNDWLVDDIRNEWVVQEEEITGVQAAEADLKKFIKEGNDVHKCMIMGDPAVIEQIETHLKTAFPALTIYKSKTTYLEIMSGTASKAKAIKALAQVFDISQQEVFAIGDNYNDIDMLQYAGIGIAMGNSPDEVKQMADEVTLSNDEDGLVHSIQRHFG